VPRNLKRYYGRGDLHFITFSCHQRRPLLASPARRDLFLRMLERTRRQYLFTVVGYVIMPEHVHLLVSEPQRQTLAVALKALKQGMARRVLGRRKPGGTAQSELFASPAARHFWQARYYDFNVWSKKKTVEKLRYMHRNPVKRGLVDSPEQWRWSSFRHYLYGESGAVVVDEVFAPRWAKSIKPGTPLPTQAALVWGTQR
jgi:putative transposase